jgi:two-component system, chemotaxis family, CheB/CheR fusion protein
LAAIRFARNRVPSSKSHACPNWTARRRIAAPRRRTVTCTSPPFSVIGIGAAAGGLFAFRRLLSALPADSGAAFAFVQHLEPAGESLLVQLLADATLMPIVEVDGPTTLAGNSVYIARPGESLQLDGEGQLTSLPRLQGVSSNRPIDAFFMSLAESRGAHCAGVVWAGTGNDGTRSEPHGIRPGT